MQLTTIFALVATLGSVMAAPSPDAAVDVITKRDADRTMELFRRTMADTSGEILKRQSAACWICLASCGFGGGWNCGCCSDGRACASDCPE
ncbi:uncharacterized protein RHO25_006082 [Cercospora beticola]|uniref:Uncharacterized protein n=1 Tax=Cercospora beticola TaxID=122368 RepID=A0ABZ0NPH8_CERBT|nr:hypothetical protein RHO25_006082 [Cercospora beticola]CAK1363757.1 unnamed protein product [Cercospora beticola]